MSQYFPKPYEPLCGDINVKVELSNYAKKADLKNATGIDTSKLAAKSDIVSLKAEVDKLDIAKLTPVPNDLANLSNVVKNDVVKKTEYDKLISKNRILLQEPNMKETDQIFKRESVNWLKKQISMLKLLK